MAFLNVLLPVAVLACAALHCKSSCSANERWGSHVAVVIATCVVDLLLMSAFALSADYGNWAWVAAGSVFSAAVAGNCILLLGSWHVQIRPYAYYVASTLMVASAVCCMSIDSSVDAGGLTEASVNIAPFIVSAVMLAAAAVFIVVLARPESHEWFSKKRDVMALIAFIVAVVIVIASAVANMDLSASLALETPLNYFEQDLSTLVAILLVLSAALFFYGRKRPSWAIALVVSIIPALLLLVGMDVGVAIVLLIGLMIACGGDVKRSVVCLLFGLVALGASAMVSPSFAAEVASYVESINDASDGGASYEQILLFATSSSGIELLGDGDRSLYTGYGAMSLLANSLGMPTFMLLVFMCVIVVIGYHVTRKRVGSGHSIAFPLGIVVLGLSFVAVLSEFGLLPVDAPLPFVRFYSEYSTFGFMVVLTVTCICGGGLREAVAIKSTVTVSLDEDESEESAESDEESVGTFVVPVIDLEESSNAPASGDDEPSAILHEGAEEALAFLGGDSSEEPAASTESIVGRACQKTFVIALIAVVACCSCLYLVLNEIKAGRDTVALEALTLTYSNDETAGYLDGNLLAGYVEGEPYYVASSLFEASQQNGEDGALFRLMRYYRDEDYGVVVVEEVWRFMFLNGIIDASELSDVPYSVVSIDVLPAGDFAIADLIDASVFEETLQYFLDAYDGEPSLTTYSEDNVDAVAEALVNAVYPVTIMSFDVSSTSSYSNLAYGTFTVEFEEVGTVEFQCRFTWDGSDLTIDSITVESIVESFVEE